MESIRATLAFAFNSRTKFSLWIIPLLLLADAVLSTFIVLKVPYTEIDWTAYMEQAALYLRGERDYAAIKGNTGPLVYPAGHVYIYSCLYQLTENGTNIPRAQWLFMVLYLLTLAVVLLCYREARAPPYILPLMVLSKRLHSIYVLRLFNDPFSIFFLFVGIFCWQKRFWTLGSMSYSMSVAVKMNTLLVIPAVAVILLQAVGRGKAIRQASIMAQVQVLLAMPFMATFPKSYLSRAFELTRKFLFKWTVNWRFIGEEVFLSRGFSLGLLGVQAILILLFFVAHWKQPSQRSLFNFAGLVLSRPSDLEEREISLRVTPRFILCSILSANTIGMLCARSLHYQFYSWLAWGTPYVLWQSGLGPLWIYPLWAVQEWAWNVFPSTDTSSKAVVGVLGLSIGGLLWGGRNAEESVESSKAQSRKKRA